MDCEVVAVDILEAKYTPQSPYVYCSNNPIVRTDETGMGDEKKEQVAKKNNDTYKTPEGKDITVSDATGLYIGKKGDFISIGKNEQQEILSDDILLGFSTPTGVYTALFSRPDPNLPSQFSGYINQFGEMYKEPEGHWGSNTVTAFRDANERIKYENRNEANAAEAIEKIDYAEQEGNLAAAEKAARSASEKRNISRIYTQNRLSPGSKLYSQKIDPPGSYPFEEVYTKYSGKGNNEFATYRGIANASGKSSGMSGTHYYDPKPLKNLARFSRGLAAVGIIATLIDVGITYNNAPEGRKGLAVFKKVYSLVVGALISTIATLLTAIALTFTGGISVFWAFVIQAIVGTMAGYYGSMAGDKALTFTL